MAEFHFLRPYWLLGVVAALALLFVARRRYDPRRQWQGVIADHLLARLVIQPQEGWQFRPFHLTALSLAIGAIAAAGPSWAREQPPFVEDRAPLVIAMDVSETMDAIDVTPTRLERAKLKVRDLLALRQGARTAIVAYAGSAHTVLPLTDDAAMIQTYLDALNTRIMPIRGRDTVAALEAIDQALAREDTPGTMLLLTGGVEDAAFDRLRAAAAGGRHQPLVLGIGTAEGGPVRTGPQTYLTDAAGARVFARLDVPALERLRSVTGVPVATITSDTSDVQWIQRRVQSHLQQRQAETNARWRDEGWWATLPLIVLGALWFRRGWTIRWSAAGALIVMLFSPSAASAQASPWLNPWLTADQQGRLALERGDAVAAAAVFADPMWRGAALYRAGKFADALDAFARVNSPESDYNQGNCLAKLGKFPEAVARYQAALKARPQFPQATANLTLVRKLIPPKPKEDNQDAGDPSFKPDKIVFDDKGKQGKRGRMDGGVQTADVWMRNIQTSPAELLRRKFAIEAQGRKP